MPVPMASTSPRYLVTRNLARASKNALTAPSTVQQGDGDIKLPDPDYMQLYSSFKPSLVAGNYTITVSQHVSIPGVLDEKVLGDDNVPLQSFEVIAPQFKIESADMHSTYPPQGHADQPNVLPHIAFNDPHLPWERIALLPPVSSGDGEQAERNDTFDIIPWLAIFPFDCNGPAKELQLTSEQLNGLVADSAVKLPPNPQNPSQGLTLKQGADFTVPMTLQEYLSLPKTSTSSKIFIPNIAANDVEDPLDMPVTVVFLKAALFKDLFVNQAGNAVDIYQYRYTAHVRIVNTNGMPSSGVADEHGLFSIVHSRRTGPTDIAQNTAPRSQAVHLISIEHVALISNSDLRSMTSDSLVAFVSLQSWTYLCQPPMSVNFVDSMRAIGDQINNEDLKNPQCSMLRAPESLVAPLRQAIKIAGSPDASDMNAVKTSIKMNAMLARLENGYTLVRQRTVSGQETVAFNRGALLPVSCTPPSADWQFSSHNGQDYQILDCQLGIMDISYSTAWQLGKTMAISDLGFVAALLRVRAKIYNSGVVAAKAVQASMMMPNFKAKGNVLNNLSNSLTAIQNVSKAANMLNRTPPDLEHRWGTSSSLKTTADSIPHNHADVRAAFIAGAQQQMLYVASIGGSVGNQPYDEIGLAADTDWAFVQSWVLDRMYLSGIPGHYLVPDPSFLPMESIRFFHIDTNWRDCYLDGVLSVANHMDQQDDLVRGLIKGAINAYLSSNVPPNVDSSKQHHPQVPRYGFLLRSAVVDAFPDLVVTAPFPTADGLDPSGRAPLLVNQHMGKGILMGLLDRLPDSGELTKLKFMQPPHQQRFSAGDILEDTSIEFLFRDPRYTRGEAKVLATDDFLHEIGEAITVNRPIPTATKPTLVYDWDTRCLNMFELEKLINGVVPNSGSLNSAVAGLELNDTMKYLEIVAPSTPTNVQPSAPSVQLAMRPKFPAPASKAPHNIRVNVPDTSDHPGAQKLETIKTIMPRPQSIPPLSQSKPASFVAAGKLALTTPPVVHILTPHLPIRNLANSARVRAAPETVLKPSGATATGRKAASKLPVRPVTSGSQSRPTTSGSPSKTATTGTKSKPMTKTTPNTPAGRSMATSTPSAKASSSSAVTKATRPSTQTSPHISTLHSRTPDTSTPPRRSAATSSPAARPSVFSTVSKATPSSTQSTPSSSTRSMALALPPAKPSSSPAVPKAIALSIQPNPSFPSPVPTTVISPTEHPQQYTCCIYPSTRPYQEHHSYLFVDAPYAPDLIISLKRRGPGLPIPGISLRSIELTIPTGDPAKRGHNLAGFSTKGPGLVPAAASLTSAARMLSNQRWFVQLQILKAGYVVVRLLPRSTTRSSLVSWNNELSLRLNEVEVAGPDGSQQNPGGFVNVDVKETYGYLKDPSKDDDVWVEQGFAVHFPQVAVERRTGFVPPVFGAVG